MIFKKGLVLFCVFVIIFLLFSAGAAKNYELLTYDLRFKLIGPRPVSGDIILIEISDDTLQNLGEWPLPRDFHASLVQVLKEYGAKMIVFDILFSEQTAYDEAFAGSMKEAGKVYLAAAFHLREKRGKGAGFSAREVLSEPQELFKQSARGFGHVNVLVDPDGKTRRVPLFIRYQDSVVAQLGLLAAADYLGADVNKLSLPLADDGSFLVKYPAKWVNSFRHLSYFEILKSYSQIKLNLKPDIDLSLLKGKVCFIGLTAAGTSDLRPTPLENIYPMLGLQASVFNSIIKGDFIRQSGTWPDTLITFFIFCLALFFCLKFAPLKAFLASLGIALAYTLLACLLFTYAGLWVSLFLPLLIIVFIYIAVTSYRFFLEVKKRELLEKELEIARQIQQSFLPQPLDETTGVSISADLIAAKFVAGDLYDIFKIDNGRTGIFIGDVSGKGVPAALIMAQTILLFRMHSRSIERPKAVLDALNKELYAKFSGRFVTALYIVVDSAKGTLTVASAGHAPVLLCRREEVSELEIDSGFPLGVSDEAEYNEVLFSIAEGDKYMVFTDGANEARNISNKEFGIAALKDAFYASRQLDSQKQLARLKQVLSVFSGGRPQHDDITMVIMEITGAGND